jgi:beta-lactamase class A
MPHFSSRRSLLRAVAAAPLMRTLPANAVEGMLDPASAGALLAALEARSGGRLGVVAVDTASGVRIHHRADERFPFCSTFKVVLAGAVLARSVHTEGLLLRRMTYGKDDLVSHSPVTGKHVADGMTVAELCRAALQYSDNTASNLLTGLLGGPSAVTAFARAIGDSTFRLDRLETALNTALPGDPRDTTTPAAMARTLQSLALGDTLPASLRTQLQDWLRGNTTGAKRIRAGVPDAWQVGDKTGSGAHGTSNDIAVLWRPERAPIVLTVYFTQPEPDAQWNDGVIAAAARIAADALG